MVLLAGDPSQKLPLTFLGGVGQVPKASEGFFLTGPNFSAAEGSFSILRGQMGKFNVSFQRKVTMSSYEQHADPLLFISTDPNRAPFEAQAMRGADGCWRDWQEMGNGRTPQEKPFNWWFPSRGPPASFPHSLRPSFPTEHQQGWLF